MSDPLLTLLEERFGFAAFQPGQRDVIESVLSGRPTVAIMPTGAGKSLCYQLPAVARPGLALVVSPLIALMKDQVDGLQARGIRAEVINSHRTAAEQRDVMRAARQGEVELLYVAPERFGNAWFRSELEAVRVALLAIDEAHCISRWGHDFRPDYRELGAVARQLAPDALLACTATATPEVRDDIVASLGLDEPAVFVSGFLRDNLFVDVRFCSGDRQKEKLLVDFVRHGPVPADPGAPDHGAIIVYATTRKRVDALKALLAEQLDEPVVAYHAGMDPEARERTQDAFMSGRARIVVATNAFGMGVDRRDVRAVIHAAMPATVEGYYQEIGRAGRDGRQSWCVLLYNANDSRVHEFLIDKSDSHAHRELELSKLEGMRRWVHGDGCRHRTILAYFGERPPESCPGCSRCGPAPRLRAPDQAAPTEVDVEVVRKALAGVARSRGRFGLKRVAAMLAGSRAREVAATPLASMSTFGILGSLGVEGCSRVLQLLVDEGLCTIVGGRYPLIAIEPLGIEVMTGRVELDFALPSHLTGQRIGTSVRARGGRPGGRSAAGAGAPHPPEDADPRLVESLRAWRAEKAGAKPAYTVFADRTLVAIAVAPPASEQEFLATPGLGAGKWRAFGEELLERIRATLSGEL